VNDVEFAEGGADIDVLPISPPDIRTRKQFAALQGPAAQLFLSNFANRAGSGGGARVALAEACDVACDAATRALWGAWGGAVGGTGTIAGNDNAGTFTYSVGGFSGGLDRKITDNFLAGVTVGYQTGGQWTGGFDGRSVTDSVQAGLYASFQQGPLYVDAVAAYAYSANQLWRPINIAGLQPRTAYGQAGANQFLGQIEAGWRFDLGGAPGYFITPFALLQGSTATQNAHRDRRAVAQPQRGAADHELAAHHLRRPARRLDGSRPARQDRGTTALRLEPRIFRHGAAGDGVVRGRAFGAVHGVRRGADARWCGAGLLGQHRHRRGDGRLPALRRHHRRPGFQPRAHRRPAHELVAARRPAQPV
jgi:Autotransporter beta-domain